MAEIPRRSMGYDERDSIYSCLPLFHATALINSMFVSLVAGARIVIAPRFSVSGFWADIHDSQATATPFLGAMTPLLIGREPDDQERGHRLRTGMMVPARAAERSVFRERFGVEVVEPYGLTDYGWLAWPSAGEPVPAGSVGRPHESFEVKIVDDRDREVSPGVPGEVIARAREPWTAPTGYWGMPEETLRSRRNLWFHTGDLLRSDEDGYLYFVDRGKDAMRRRGENVSSFEVERAVMAHPDVEDCAAYAVTSDLTEDEIAIAVVFVEGRRADPAAVLASIESRLPYFAVPRYVRIMSALPRTQTEKVVKSELRDAGITADTWDGDAAGFRVTR